MSSYMYDFKTIKLINTITFEELTLSDDPTLSNEYVLETVDWGVASATSSYVSYMEQLGSDKISSYLGTRDITIDAWVVASDRREMTRLKKFLNKLINPFNDIDLIYGKYIITFSPDQSIRYAIEIEDNNDIMCKFTIQGTAAIPLFGYIDEIINEFPLSLPIKVFAMEIPIDKGIPLGLAGYQYERSVINEGDVPMWYELIIENVSEERQIINPKINVHYVNTALEEVDEFIKLMTTLNHGDKIIINSKYGSESIIKIDSEGIITDLITQMTRDSVIFLLEQGENIMTITDDSGQIENIDFIIKYTPLFLEVEE